MRAQPPIPLVVLAALACPVATTCASEASRSVQSVIAGPIRVELILDRTMMNAADTLGATLRVTAPSGVRVELPSPTGRLGAFAIGSSSDDAPRADLAAAGLETTRIRRFTLEPFLPGDYRVPAIEVPWARPDTGEHGVARTAPVEVHVLSLLPDPAGAGHSPDPGTIRETYSTPAPRSTRAVILVVGAAMGVLGVGGAGVWAYRRRRESTDPLAAIEHRVKVLRAGPGPGRPNLDACDDLASCVRLALAQRVHPLAASLAPGELPGRLGWALSPARAHDAAQLLDELDAARFSEKSIGPGELRAWVDGALALLGSLRTAPPSRTEGEARA